MKIKDVIEFIIVPPFEQKEAVMAAKERFEHFLSNRFPGYTFRMSPFVPVGDSDDFCVLPIMNFLGDDGRSYMCNEPKRWFMQEIAAACGEFDLKGLRLSQPKTTSASIQFAGGTTPRNVWI